jgi:PIN domain nuclease of toxin-antitoxin system
MRLLLDTHVLLWAVASSRRLSKEARGLIVDPENEVFYSAASLWEIAIKSALKQADFRIDVDVIAMALPESGFAELPVRAGHAVAVAKLPNVHHDPFDRMLLAQALTEPLVLITNDAVLTKYPAPVRLV